MRRCTVGKDRQDVKVEKIDWTVVLLSGIAVTVTASIIAMVFGKGYFLSAR